MNTRRPKGMPRWKWHEQLDQFGMSQEKMKVDILGTLFVCLLAISIPVFIFLFPYTLYRNSQAGQCFKDCQDNKCKLTEGRFWCYQWEYIEFTPTIGSYFQCSSGQFSTKKECVEGCFGYCPSRMPWKYTIIVGTPVLIAIFMLMREFSKSRSRGSDEYF